MWVQISDPWSASYWLCDLGASYLTALCLFFHLCFVLWLLWGATVNELIHGTQ